MATCCQINWLLHGKHLLFFPGIHTVCMYYFATKNLAIISIWVPHSLTCQLLLMLEARKGLVYGVYSVCLLIETSLNYHWKWRTCVTWLTGSCYKACWVWWSLYIHAPCWTLEGTTNTHVHVCVGGWDHWRELRNLTDDAIDACVHDLMYSMGTSRSDFIH